jgi:hypothetical protein
MMERRLQNQLGALAQIQRRARRSRALTFSWLAATAFGVALLVLQNIAGGAIHPDFWLLPLAAGLVLGGVVLSRHAKTDDQIRDLIREFWRGRPEVRHLLAAASEQKPDAESGAYGFLQLRLIEEALTHPGQAEWRRQLRQRRNYARIAQGGALLALLAVSLALRPGKEPGSTVFSSLLGEEITVTPGDTKVERGTGLVIAARFGGSPPGEAALVVNSAGGKEARLNMARRLADPVFGASIPEVNEAGIYHIEYRGKKTRDYKITVFEFPALVRADASLVYPAYTGLTNRTIRDTLRVSAVEGSRLSYALQLNKPVARARWIAKDQSFSLATPGNALAILSDYLLTNNARYSLELVDAEGRSNKFPTDFILQALTNQRPVVKLTFPRGDPRVSRLEELELQAEASDDFGLLKYGVGYGVAGQEPQFVELGQTSPANAKVQFNYLIPLKQLGVDVDQVVAYFAWADDYGPDGQARRTFGDMFFAEVRPFEEIFRADQSGGGEGGNQGGNQGQGQGGGNERVRLADLQKQIVVATWNLQREKTGAGGAHHP